MRIISLAEFRKEAVDTYSGGEIIDYFSDKNFDWINKSACFSLDFLQSRLLPICISIIEWLGQFPAKKLVILDSLGGENQSHLQFLKLVFDLTGQDIGREPVIFEFSIPSGSISTKDSYYIDNEAAKAVFLLATMISTNINGTFVTSISGECMRVVDGGMCFVSGEVDRLYFIENAMLTFGVSRWHY